MVKGQKRTGKDIYTVGIWVCFLTSMEGRIIMNYVHVEKKIGI